MVIDALASRPYTWPALRRRPEELELPRNATAHELDAEQFTEANALRGLMLATAAVRELEFERSDEWLHASSFKRPQMKYGPSYPSMLMENSAMLHTLIEGMRSPALVTVPERASKLLSFSADASVLQPKGSVVVPHQGVLPAKARTVARERAGERCG